MQDRFLAIRIEDSLHKRLSTQSRKAGLSLSSFVKMVLTAELNKREKEEVK